MKILITVEELKDRGLWLAFKNMIQNPDDLRHKIVGNATLTLTEAEAKFLCLLGRRDIVTEDPFPEE